MAKEKDVHFWTSIVLGLCVIILVSVVMTLANEKEDWRQRYWESQGNCASSINEINQYWFDALGSCSPWWNTSWGTRCRYAFGGSAYECEYQNGSKIG